MVCLQLGSVELKLVQVARKYSFFMDFIRGTLVDGFEEDAPVKIQAAVKLVRCAPV